ncbi:VOC family protein [Micromonospora costi]|uniref:VOC family protein n=1 Tax=Micromonospora costi TaxID=1530042 RepID=UPI0033E2520D
MAGPRTCRRRARGVPLETVGGRWRVVTRVAQYTLDVTDVDRMVASWSAEVRRLVDLGARHADVGQTGDEHFVVIADPEGNEFCVLDRPPARP